MDLFTLERAINTLETSLDSLGGWLTFWTTLVVLGLIVEYADDLKELLIKRPFNWKLFRTIVGGLLITGGVAGELFVQFKESKLSTDLRSANHEVVALLNDHAAQAGKDAESAKAAAKGFESSIADSSAPVK